MLIVLVIAIAWTVNKITPHETPGFSALTDEEAELLVRTCTRQATPNPLDPRCFIRQGDRIYGLSMIVTGSMPSGGAQGLVSSFSYDGNPNFGVNIPTYMKYPRGVHILPNNPEWSTLRKVYLSGGRLANSTTP